MRVLICSTPVGPLGSGNGGGVELTLHSIVIGMSDLGHHIEVVAPAGSLHVGSRVHQIEGVHQSPSQTAARDAPIGITAQSVLANMWDFVRVHQHRYDVVLNLAYDWLPLYVAPFLRVPVAHLISMGSLTDAMDEAIRGVHQLAPESIAMHSRAQAETFAPLDDVRVVGSGISLERYDVQLTAAVPPALGFVGRISPEKGLEDVAEVSARTGMPVRVWGLMQDRAYWNRVIEDHPDARLIYEGFLATDELQEALGSCVGILMASKWVEAFGIVAIEALATGVPVIAYRRGGPAEIVIDGRTGFLVEPDDVDALVRAVHRLGDIDRVMCRQHVEEQYSARAFAERIAIWFDEVVKCHTPVVLNAPHVT